MHLQESGEMYLETILVLSKEKLGVEMTKTPTEHQ